MFKGIEFQWGTRPSRSAAVWLLVGLLVLLTSLTVACSKSGEEPERPRLQEPIADAEPPKALVEVFHELADIMGDSKAPPEQILKDVRNYIQENRTAIEAAVKEIERTSLNLSDAERSEYVSQHAEDAREAIERFARAQQRLRDRANEAQKVELTEILNTL